MTPDESLREKEKFLTLSLPVLVSGDGISGKCFLSLPAKSGSVLLGNYITILIKKYGTLEHSAS